MPCFSVVIPAYNRAYCLRDCLQSVARQTVADWECIVVDDGSTDGTQALVAAIAGYDARFRSHRQENAGPSPARNAGVARAAGEWVVFLDSDDQLFPTALETYRSAIAATQDAQIIAAYLEQPATQHVSAGGQVSTGDAFHALTAFSREPNPPLTMSSSAVRRSVFTEVGPFSGAYRTAEDTEFWIRASARCPITITHTFVARQGVERPDGALDAAMATGRQIDAMRRVLADVIRHPVVQARLGVAPDRAAFEQWHQAYLLALESAALLRDGESVAAADILRQAAFLCDEPWRLDRIAAIVQHYLYAPWNRPREAVQRCGVLLAGLRRAIPRSEPLWGAVSATASDMHFLVAADLRSQRQHRDACAVCVMGLRRVPSLRSAKSFVRLLYGRLGARRPTVRSASTSRSVRAEGT